MPEINMVILPAVEPSEEVSEKKLNNESILSRIDEKAGKESKTIIAIMETIRTAKRTILCFLNNLMNTNVIIVKRTPTKAILDPVDNIQTEAKTAVIDGKTYRLYNAMYIKQATTPLNKVFAT